MNCLYPIDHNCCKFVFSQHPFIESAKSVSVLNSMIQEALNIMEEESTREENEVRFVTLVGNYQTILCQQRFSFSENLLE